MDVLRKEEGGRRKEYLGLRWVRKGAVGDFDARFNN